MHLQWLSQHNISFTIVLEYIPLVATVATTILSLVLARATLRYAKPAIKAWPWRGKNSSVNGLLNYTSSWIRPALARQES
jgi:hypothetical protein